MNYCILIGANLSGANLSGANLSGANLSGANLSGASIRCYISNSILLGIQNYQNLNCKNSNFVGSLIDNPKNFNFSQTKWKSKVYHHIIKKKTINLKDLRK